MRNLIPTVALILLAATTLSACDKSEKQAADSRAAAKAAQTERAGPISWNASAAVFEMNGAPLRTARLWTFRDSADGFAAVGSKIAPTADGLSMTVADPTLRSPKGLAIDGADYQLVLVRLTRTAAGEAWNGALYYSTPGHPESGQYFGKPVIGGNPALSETTTMVYNMSQLVIGGGDWSQSIINQIRLDIEDKPGGAFVIHQIAIVQNPDASAFRRPEPAPKPAPAPAAKPAEAP
ncbi:hypothetical protein ACN2C6_01570 [Caulobacter sp. ErkDOM-YI]|uniref:hypothetical protein n=1 Tax=unclassified Caulobacter TaxID=2648921 RepID=UPI003AF430B7